MITTNNRISAFIVLCFCTTILFGCGQDELKPVELFPEDECANCKMTVSNPSFASEIISANREVFKFDDLACLETFRKKRTEIQIAAIFVKDYESKQWLPYERSVLILTGIETPMGSGKIAVRSNERAKILAAEHPVKNISETIGKGCCTDSECE